MNATQLDASLIFDFAQSLSILSLLLAPDLRSFSPLLTLLFLLGLSSGLRVQKLLIKVLKGSSVLALLEVLRIGSTVLEGFSEKFSLIRVQEVAGREDYLELEVEIATGHGILIEGHAESLDSLQFFVLQDFSRCSGNEVFLAVEVVDGSGDSGECFQQGDFLMVDQVSPASFEDFMRQEIDPNVDVTGQSSWEFIAFAVEDVVVGVGDALLDSNFDGFLCLFQTLAITPLAPVSLLEYGTQLVAFVAWRLSLREHSGAHLNHLVYSSQSLAVGAGLGIGSTLPLAVSAHSKPGHFHLLRRTSVDLFESDIDFDQFWL